MITPRQSLLTALCATAILALAACDRSAPKSEEPAPTAAAAPAAPASQAVVPQPAETPASGTNGPADGTTAIGGVPSNQDAGGAKVGGAPAPTGGDGAASHASN